MGIFDKIKHAIFGDEAKAATLNETAAPPSPVSPNPTAPTPVSPGGVPGMSAPAPAAAPTPTPSGVPSPVPSAAVDIAPILDRAVAKSGQKLDWRHSIVDLMKAVGLEASLADRKELAAELHYTGDTHDSAAMNTWLHKALMAKLKENGGKVPADLAD